MKKKILITAPYFQPVVEQYRSFFEKLGLEIVVPPVRERLSEKELLQYIGEIAGVISGDDQFTAKVFQAAPQLKVISKWGTGIDSIDREAAKKHGVAVRNTPDAFTQPVADTVLGYIACFARQLPWMDRAIRAGQWKKIPSVALNECTLGIVGVGNIGRAVARRANASGMKLIGNDIVDIPAEFLRETGMEKASKEELLEKADFVSLNCDLNPTSFHILSGKEFARMKPTAVVINTARGPLIDEPALVQALQNKKIAGAALDVFEDEPLPTNSPLRTLDNVLLAAHNANSSPKAWKNVHERTVNNLLESLGIKL